MLLPRSRDVAKFCEQRVCLWVCLSVCLSVSSHCLKKPQNFAEFSVHVFVAVARSSGDSAIRYLLPVLDEVA